MKRICLTILLLSGLILSSVCPAQVRFDGNFEGGAFGSAELLDSTSVIVAPGDTVVHLSYLINGKYDPENPIDVTLEPSANWYYFRMTGVAGKQIYLTLKDNGVARSSFSYDGETWEHLPLAEFQRRRLDKRFTRDTVFIALYNPYTYSYLQERIKTWTEHPDVLLDTIGFSHEGRPLQLMHITDLSVPAEKKARLWIHARQHPSESPSSALAKARRRIRWWITCSLTRPSPGRCADSSIPTCSPSPTRTVSRTASRAAMPSA